MKVTGWLVPGGEFIQCELWQHLEVIGNHTIFIQRVPEVDKLLSALKKTYDSCQEMADREGAWNAEWHVYEIHASEVGRDIWRLLLNNGFIRVGESDDNIHFEGRPNYIKSRYQECKDFADSYGAGAVFEPQR